MYRKIITPGHCEWPNTNTNNFLVVPELTTFDTSNGYTFIFTVRVEQWVVASNADTIICQRSDGTEPWWEVRFNALDLIQVFYGDGVNPNVTTTAASADAITSLPVNEWHTIAVVFRPNVEGVRRAFSYLLVDGEWVELGSSVGGAPIDPVEQSTAPLSIGAYASTGGNAMNGKQLQRVALYEGTDGDLPGGTLVFEFDGSELEAANIDSFRSKSGHLVNIGRNSNNPLVVVPRVPQPMATPDPGHFSMPGLNGNALYVPDPSPDYWTIPPEGLTMVFWLRRFNAWDDQGSARFLLATQLSSSTSGWDLRLTTAGALSFASYAEGVIQYTQAASLAQMTSNLPLGVWHEIAVTYTPNNGTHRRASAFKRVGGEWVAIGGATNPVITPTPPLRALAIGAGNMSGGNNIACDLGYVAIYHGTDSNLTPNTSGDPIFEFDGTDIHDADASEFLSRSGHRVTVTRDTMAVVPAKPNAYYGSEPVWDAFFNGKRAAEVELPEA